MDTPHNMDSRKSLVDDMITIDLKDLLIAIWSRRILFIACVLISCLLTTLIALSKPNIYYSEATLIISPSHSGNSVGIASSLGSLARFAGVTPNNDMKITSALEILKSRAFLISFINEHALDIPLAATSHWSEQEQKWVINHEVYDEKNATWLNEMDSNGDSRPSDMELYEQLFDRLRIALDKNQQILRIGFESQSPIAAADWTKWLISDLNAFLSQRDIDTAEQKIANLTEQISKTSESQLQSVLYDLVAEQMEVIVLASNAENYAFTVIDPPLVPEKKLKPNRKVYVAGGFLLGVILAILITTIQYSYTVYSKRTE